MVQETYINREPIAPFKAIFFDLLFKKNQKTCDMPSLYDLAALQLPCWWVATLTSYGKKR